ncbi:MAG: Flp pilus assembly protein CpaB [Bryobacteraceae bacterium]
MKKNLIPLVSIAFVVAAICTAVFYGLVAGRLTSPASANSNGAMLVAARSIASGQRVSAADAKAVPVSGQVPDSVFRSPAQLEGLTALRDIKANEPLSPAQLVSAEAGGGLGIPVGKRAISIQVADSAGILTVLRPGYRVDVLAIHGEGNQALAKTLLRNLEVLRVNKQPEPSPGKPALPVVTLLATPTQADALALADAVTRVRLLLRNPFDNADDDTARRLDVGALMQAPSGAASGGARRTGGVR